eukprot:9275954-Pyramimonas_sp.AAC.1
MRWRMHIHVIRAGRTAKSPLGWSRNRAVRLSGKTRVVQIVPPYVGHQHGRQIWVAIERATSCLEKLAYDLNSFNKERLHPWRILRSHGQFFIAHRRMWMMAITSLSSKTRKISDG